jgi:hypothetical protein
MMQWNLEPQGTGEEFELFKGYKVLVTDRKVRINEYFELQKHELSTFHFIIEGMIKLRWL